MQQKKAFWIEQVFLENGPASFSFIFGLFKQTVQFLQQIK